jgi:hypothetical protein
MPRLYLITKDNLDFTGVIAIPSLVEERLQDVLNRVP